MHVFACVCVCVFVRMCVCVSAMVLVTWLDAKQGKRGGTRFAAACPWHCEADFAEWSCEVSCWWLTRRGLQVCFFIIKQSDTPMQCDRQILAPSPSQINVRTHACTQPYTHTHANTHTHPYTCCTPFKRALQLLAGTHTQEALQVL